MNLKKDWKTIYQTDQDWLRVRKDGSEPRISSSTSTRSASTRTRKASPRRSSCSTSSSRCASRSPATRSDPTSATSCPKATTSRGPTRSKTTRSGSPATSRKSRGSTWSTVKEAVAGFTSADPTKRARAYEEVASYHGYANFDTEPREINEPELDQRWS